MRDHPVRMARQLIPARQAVAVRRQPRGDARRVVNTHGQQVVDTWAFVATSAEWMSMEHSRLHMGKLNPGVGDTLVTNRRRPILTLVADTSGGMHDTLLAACDRARYELLGAPSRTTTAPTTCTRRSPRSTSWSRRRRAR